MTRVRRHGHPARAAGSHGVRAEGGRGVGVKTWQIEIVANTGMALNCVLFLSSQKRRVTSCVERYRRESAGKSEVARGVFERPVLLAIV
jgi:hypothetical protein